MTEPLWFRWNAAVMVPMRPELAERQFIPDGRYLLEAHHERSYQKHKAFFASLHDAWSSLSTDRFPTPEHLRKFALIKTGFHDQRVMVCDTPSIADRVAAFCAPFDTFAIVTVEGRVVTVFTAQSQSYKHMGRDKFKRSMDAVLDYCAGLIGVSKQELEAQGEFG